LFQARKLLARRIMDRLTPETAGRLLTLIRVGDVPEDEDEEPDLLRMIKSLATTACAGPTWTA
jgi:hypothetical protein